MAHYEQVLDSISFSSTGATAGSRTIDWSVNDGVSSSAISTSIVTVHDKPTVSAGATATFTGGGSAQPLDAGLTVSDVSSPTLASATVSIGAGYISGDTLNFTNGAADGNIEIASNGNGVLVLTSIGGSATLAQWDAALDSVTYSFTPANGDPTAGGSQTARTIDWIVNDGLTSSDAVTSTVDTVHVAPTVTAGAIVTFVQGGSAVTLDSGLTLTAPDSNGDIGGATVSVVGGSFATDGDTLTPNVAGTSIIGVYNATTETLTLSGTDTVAHYEQVLDSISFNSSGATAGSRTIDWSVNDGVSSSAISTSIVTVHDKPTVSAGATATFTGGGSAQPLDSGLTVSDVSSPTLASATVSIGAGYISGDTLNFTNMAADGNIEIAGNGNGVLVLTSIGGTATLAQWDAALDSVTYSVTPANGDPTAGGTDTSRTVSYVVSDGVTSSDAVTSTLDTMHVAPVVTPSGTTSTFTGGGAAVTLDGALTVSDVDSNGDLASATVSIGSGFLSGDTLNFTNQNGITGSYDATHGVLTLGGTASLANYQAALDSISYSFVGTDPLSTTDGDPTGGGSDTTRTISFVVSDGSTQNGSSAAATSTLDTVHVAPEVKAGATSTFTGGGAAVTLDGALTVSDVDSNGDLAGATVSIGSGFLSGDTLNFINQNGITGSYDTTHGVLTLGGTATLANYQAALDSISYSFVGTDPLSTTDGDPTGGGSDTTRTISFVVSDGSTQNGSSAAATSTVDTVHVAPTVTAGATATFTGGGAAVLLDGALTVSDIDSNGDLASATVSIGSGFLSGDTLNFTNQNGITGSYDATHGVLTLGGTASLANYQAALDSISYSFVGTDPLSTTDGDPTGGGSDTTRTISFVVSDGSTQNGSSAAATSTLDTMHVAPVVTPSGTTSTFTGGGAAVTLDGALTVSDVDSNGDLAGATVSIGTGFLSGDTLNFINQNGITGSYDATHGVLTLGGTATLANYQAALESITFGFNAASLDATAGGADTTRSISWTVNDGVASSVAATSTLDAVHVPPTVTAGNSLTFDANNLQPVVLDSAIIVGDVDKTTLAGAQVAITGGFAAGFDSLGFANGHGIAGSYDSATGVLTLSGVASVADYQAALASVTFMSSTQVSAARTVQWTVDDGNTGFDHSLPAKTSINVEGLIIDLHVLPTAPPPPAALASAAAFVVPSNYTGLLAPPSGGFNDGFGSGAGVGGTGLSGGHAFGYTVMHTDVALNTASDASIQIDLTLASLEAPLGGDVAFVTARLANGDPLPDWLKFDPSTGSFAGLPPQGMFASLAPNPSSDSDIVTGTLPPAPGLDGDGAAVAGEQTYTVEVQARDSRGNIVVTIFTIDLRPHAGRHGWNIERGLQPLGSQHHAGTALHDLAAGNVATPFEPFGAHVMPVHRQHDTGPIEAVPAGRAGLSEQMAAIGWRSMHAQRNALLASLQRR